MAAHASATKIRFQRKQIVILLVMLVGLYILLPQLGLFKHSLHLLGDATPRDLGYAAGATVVTYLAASGTYCLLAFKKLRYWRTFLVQLAAMFVNRLLPAGIGGIGANYEYLRHSKHTTSQAGSVVAANNLLGLFGNALLVVIVIVGFHSQLPALQFVNSNNGKTVLVAIIVLAALVFFLFLYKKLRLRLQKLALGVLRQLANYRQRPMRVLVALATSLSLTLGNVAGLYFCSQSLHGGLSFVPILLIFTLGIALGTATPTPGGLGGVEAGMVAGFIAYNVPSSQALAIVLAYRLITYWIPLIIGGTAFAFVQHRGYFSQRSKT